MFAFCTLLFFSWLLFTRTGQIRNLSSSNCVFSFSSSFINFFQFIKGDLCLRHDARQFKVIFVVLSRSYFRRAHPLNVSFFFSWQPGATEQNTRRSSQIQPFFSLLSHSNLLLTPDYSPGYRIILPFPFYLRIVLVFESVCCLICIRKLQSTRISVGCW